jgi:hypothetical protein
MIHLKQDLGQFYNAIWCIKLNPFTVVLQNNYYDKFKTSVDTIL